MPYLVMIMATEAVAVGFDSECAASMYTTSNCNACPTPACTQVGAELANLVNGNSGKFL
jgi:hypothetical protein